MRCGWALNEEMSDVSTKYEYAVDNAISLIPLYI